MGKIKAEIIKYSKMLNSRKLSALRSGNISVRYKDGFLKCNGFIYVKYYVPMFLNNYYLLLKTSPLKGILLFLKCSL